MMNRFICCFKNTNAHNVLSPTTSLHVKENECEIDDNNCPRIQNNDSIDWKDTVQFVPPVEKGIVIKVYDGDTITIASKLPYPESLLYRFSVRLNGIDCPEIKGKDENEKQCAEIAKQEMNNLIMNKIVTLKNIQTEKYGRILADVYIDDLHLNNYMLEKRLAIAYDGGTKKCPKNWMQYYVTGEF